MVRLLLLILGLSSCAASSGREWLSSPIDERPAPNVSNVVETHAATASRPRLSHTVTLGESYAASSSAVVVGAPASPVQVNVHVPVTINNNVGGYGYGYGYYPVAAGGRPAMTRPAASTPTKVGGDFPAPPDYGPRALK